MPAKFISAALAPFAFVLAVASTSLAESLPELNLDADATIVSGLSSGGFMAAQMQVAFSERIAGAGIVAGGPYFCAQGNVFTALNQCMQTLPGGPDDAALLQAAQAFAAEGKIDPLSGLADDRVYLFSGTADNTVTRPVMDAAQDYYLAAGVAPANIRYVTDVPAGHAFVVEDAPNSCGVTRANFINDCDIDQAGDILSWLYGDLNPPGSAPADGLREFDQGEFLSNPERHGMDQRGFVYIPTDCAAGETCRLHIAFHGCEQTPDQIGDLFARSTGFNRWAETNRIVVLYPQAQITSAPATNPFGGNPKGCWDWWGYDDADYALRKGRQMAAVARMAEKLGAPISGSTGPDGEDVFCARHAAANWRHWMEGRAEFCGFVALCTVGSGEVIGTFFGSASLFESPEGTYSSTPCDG